MAGFWKQQLSDRPAGFSRYIDEVADGDLLEVLARYGDLAAALDPGVFAGIGERAYAPGKWTVNAVVQHVVDTERIFAYRALRFARRDATALPGFDENAYAAAAPGGRSFAELCAEFRAVRAATCALFASFDVAALTWVGNANGTPVSAGSLGFAIVGHQVHHVGVLVERYRGLAGVE
jgi:hypothetical protein